MAQNLLIGFGTETGNSELLAMDAQKMASTQGINAKCACLDDVDLDEILLHDFLSSSVAHGEMVSNRIMRKISTTPYKK